MVYYIFYFIRYMDCNVVGCIVNQFQSARLGYLAKISTFVISNSNFTPISCCVVTYLIIDNKGATVYIPYVISWPMHFI